MTLALVALGSNLRPRRQALLDGVRDIAHLPRTRLLSLSALRETAPVDCAPDAPAFINGACLLDTGLSPRELLDALLAIERAHGRKRDAPAPAVTRTPAGADDPRAAAAARHAPRTLDLDLILHGDSVLDEPGLTLPHPRAHARLFVMEPAADLAPDLRHPVLQRTLTELRDELLACRR